LDVYHEAVDMIEDGAEQDEMFIVAFNKRLGVV
jgi:hypothetical protein